MTNSVDFNGRPFHFIGIGGIGMSALAYVLAKRQFPVSGSDLRPNHITHKLESIGAHIFGKQEASNLEFFRPQVLANSVVLIHQNNYLLILSQSCLKSFVQQQLTLII
ncbi:hypothetical protein ANSO36C_23070 [Nostoc cf. commune SO-36]|uniref:Mur ligase N-terminal catalytic domain-containing protein n=1 Tax=Nostoc cf. commune SO-36 TaxID=449208 RepID=A0ABM7Z0L5_NOSCO|nr:hypothetical protein ANSO36C_23070 [Nostoc cf. commune SO-36]